MDYSAQSCLQNVFVLRYFSGLKITEYDFTILLFSCSAEKRSKKGQGAVLRVES